MPKLRLRDNAQGITRPSLEYAKKNLHRLGGVHTIRGYRFTSTRSYKFKSNGEKHTYRTDHEAVLLKGPNGTMRLEGVLWGYGGTGPNGLVQVLKACGLQDVAACQIAFATRRRDNDGVDFEIKFPVALFTDSSKIMVF